MSLYNYERKMSEANKVDAKRRKNQFVEKLDEGDLVNDFFAVKSKQPPRDYKNGTWFNVVVSDKTGQISLKFWGGENKEHVKKLYNSFKVGDVIHIKNGKVEIYEDKPQISLNEKKGYIKKINVDEFDVVDFLPSLGTKKINELYDQLEKEIENIQNEQLKNLLTSFFNDRDFIKKFKECPSAISYHHNYIGGNLEHTISVINLCKKIIETYHVGNQDLLITGAILHDIGKIKEYNTVVSIDKTSEGNFIGHIVMGDRWVREKIDELRKKGTRFDESLETHISHLILSHHGRYEYGSPRIPQTIEACVLHQADNMDAQVKNFIQNIEEFRRNSDDDWAFIWDSDIGRKRNMFLREDY